ncbi:hypothetical protein [Staphylococcus chromogenes]|uniref:hypothetical protein n=1 Tax=Staphylococcus chromogenes TaxID=46126 RepID=UPI002904CD50|nr:hypothetical protein [Staphylococcus chromogenes]MDU0452318.1 hypothetical protein [Staphylococcus chromogenes]
MKSVHVTFSDGDRHIYKECDVRASNEFLEQKDMNGHVIVTPEYFNQIEKKAKAFELILQANYSSDVNNDNSTIVEIINTYLEDK